MSDVMTQEDAMNMSNEQAVQILIPMRNMMCDQNGCPISDAVFALDKAIEALSADRPQEWIPVSERLPSAEDCPMDCMVTRKSEFVGNYVDMAVAEANGTWTHEDWKAITLDGKAMCISTRDADIIAWMPLPEPYKGGEEE